MESVACGALSTIAVTPVDAHRNLDDGHPDIGVVNNSQERLPIKVRIYPEDYIGLSVFENTWELKGRNQTGVEDVSEVYSGVT